MYKRLRLITEGGKKGKALRAKNAEGKGKNEEKGGKKEKEKGKGGKRRGKGKGKRETKSKRFITY